jgi:hypothetical protein
MNDHRVQLGIGKKGSYKDHWTHGNASIAQAYFTGLSLPANTKARLVDKDGNVISKKRNL